MKFNSRSGFTLIELLVVIAIIAILAAVIFPVFAKVREKARQTACASNMRQLSLGILQYADDNDQTYPGINNSGLNPGWAGKVYPYVASVNIFHCPDDPTKSSGGKFPVSYAFNKNGIGNADSSFNEPSQTVMFLEIQGNVANMANPNETDSADGNMTGSPQTGNGGNYVTGQYPGHAITSLTPVHTGGANYAAFDGHLKWFTAVRLSGMGNNPNGSPTAPCASTAQDNVNLCATATSAMNNGGGNGSAILTMSIY